MQRTYNLETSDKKADTENKIDSAAEGVGNGSAPGWISVNDRLPYGEVLAVNSRNTMVIGYVSFHEHDGFYCDCEETMLEDVTHWMPLPEAPQNDQ